MTMLQKLQRKDALEKYTTFPTRYYDENIDEEKFFYPETRSHYWLKLEAKTTIQLKKELATEIEKLCKDLNIKKLIFLCDADSTWITKNSKNRIDYKQLTKAIGYLKDNKISSKFNGALVVDKSQLKLFLQHFYILTMCDASFSFYHFIDDNQTIIGYIHYDGELKIDPLTNASNELFLQVIKNTNFIDSCRDDTDRI